MSSHTQPNTTDGAIIRDVLVIEPDTYGVFVSVTPDQVEGSFREGNDLVIVLVDGSLLVLQSYFAWIRPPAVLAQEPDEGRVILLKVTEDGEFVGQEPVERGQIEDMYSVVSPDLPLYVPAPAPEGTATEESAAEETAPDPVETAEAPQVPQTPQTPEVTEQPQTPEVTEQDSSFGLGLPELPDLPEFPEIPGLPGEWVAGAGLVGVVAGLTGRDRAEGAGTSVTSVDNNGDGTPDLVEIERNGSTYLRVNLANGRLEVFRDYEFHDEAIQQVKDWVQGEGASIETFEAVDLGASDRSVTLRVDRTALDELADSDGDGDFDSADDAYTLAIRGGNGDSVEFPDGIVFQIDAAGTAGSVYQDHRGAQYVVDAAVGATGAGFYGTPLAAIIGNVQAVNLLMLGATDVGNAISENNLAHFRTLLEAIQDASSRAAGARSNAATPATVPTLSQLTEDDLVKLAQYVNDYVQGSGDVGDIGMTASISGRRLTMNVDEDRDGTNDKVVEVEFAQPTGVGQTSLDAAVVTQRLDTNDDGRVERVSIDGAASQAADGTADQYEDFEYDANGRVTSIRLDTDASDDGTYEGAETFVYTGSATRSERDADADGTPERIRHDADSDGNAERVEHDEDDNGSIDRTEHDADGDGNAERIVHNADAAGVNVRTEHDDDDNGSIDRTEHDADGDGNAERTVHSANAAGVNVRTEYDSDDDGTVERTEYDVDGDGTPERTVHDADGDGTPDSTVYDDNDDGTPDRTVLPSDPGAPGPGDPGPGDPGPGDPGPSGPSVTNHDTDNNGTDDQTRHDTDGDGTIDRTEFDEDENGTAERITYDADDNGSVDRTVYDTDEDGTPDRIVHNADAAGVNVRTEHDTDDNGTIDSTAYDADGDGNAERIVHDADAAGVNVRTEYDDEDNGSIDRTEYDADGDGTPERIVHNADAQGINVRTEYDTDDSGSIDRTEYDADGDGTPERIVHDADTQGTNVRTEYDTDDSGSIDRTEYDTDGDGTPERKVYNQDAANINVRTEYDDEDNGSIDRTTYDADGDGTPERTVYDTDAQGTNVRIEYDADETGMVERITYDADGDGTPERIVYGFADDADDDGSPDTFQATLTILDDNDDGSANKISYDPDGDGTANRVEDFEYDSTTGRLTSRSIDNGGTVDVDTDDDGTVDLDADGDGTVDFMVDVDGDGTFDTVVFSGTVDGTYDEVETYEYDSNGRIERIKYDNALGTVDLDGDGFSDSSSRGGTIMVRSSDGTDDRYEDFEYDSDERVSKKKIDSHVSVGGTLGDGTYETVESYYYTARGEIDRIEYDRARTDGTTDFIWYRYNSDRELSPFIPGLTEGESRVELDHDSMGRVDIRRYDTDFQFFVAASSIFDRSYFERVERYSYEGTTDRVESIRIDSIGDGDVDLIMNFVYDEDILHEIEYDTDSDGSYDYKETYNTSVEIISITTREFVNSGVIRLLDEDADGRVDYVDTNFDSGNYVIEYFYDDNGNLEEARFDDGANDTVDRIETYEYDDRGNRVSVNFDDNADGGGTGSYERIETYIYDTDDPVWDGIHLRTEFDNNANGTPDRIEHYDINEAVEKVEIFRADGSTERVEHYSPFGTIESFEDWVYGTNAQGDDILNKNYHFGSPDTAVRSSSNEILYTRTKQFTFDDNGSISSFWDSDFRIDLNAIAPGQHSRTPTITRHDDDADGVFDRLVPWSSGGSPLPAVVLARTSVEFDAANSLSYDTVAIDSTVQEIWFPAGDDFSFEPTAADGTAWQNVDTIALYHKDDVDGDFAGAEGDSGDVTLVLTDEFIDAMMSSRGTHDDPVLDILSRGTDGPRDLMIWGDEGDTLQINLSRYELHIIQHDETHLWFNILDLDGTPTEHTATLDDGETVTFDVFPRLTDALLAIDADITIVDLPLG